MARIALIDASGRAATTVEAVLGRSHEIVVRKRIHAPGDVDLVIADLGVDELMDPSTLRSLTSFGPVLLLVDKTQPVPVGIDESSDLSILRKPFDAFELRILVDRLLLAMRRPAIASPVVNREEEDAAWLEFPYVPAPAGAVLRRAARMSAPLWIFGETGCGRRRVATAVCRAALPALRVVTLYPDESLTAVLERESGSAPFALLVPEIEQRPLLEQERLAAVLSAPRGFRLIATSVDDPADRVIEGTFSRTLYQHLIGLAVQVSPLRERPLQIPPLVQALTRKVSRSLGIGDDISFSPDAMAKLQTYMWPGNLVELESVLNRTLAFLPGADAEGRSIEVEDLLFTPQDAFGAKPVDARAASVSRFPESGSNDEQPGAAIDAVGESAESGSEERVDFEQVVAGLAHDLRNPMVAIKTFAGTISGEQGEGGLGALAGDACERIDGYLEALHEYAQFETPARETVQLASLIGETVAEFSAEEPMRAVMDGGIDFEATCDPRQMRFVFDNLLAAAVEEAAAGEAVRISAESDRSIGLQARIGDGPSASLRKVLEAGDRPVSWRILLARAVARRNGFSVDVEETDGAISIRLRSSGGEEQTRGQQTNRFSR